MARRQAYYYQKYNTPFLNKRKLFRRDGLQRCRTPGRVIRAPVAIRACRRPPVHDETADAPTPFSNGRSSSGPCPLREVDYTFPPAVRSFRWLRDDAHVRLGRLPTIRICSSRLLVGDRRGGDHVLSWPPVHRRCDLVLGRKLHRIEQTEHLVEVAAGAHRI